MRPMKQMSTKKRLSVIIPVYGERRIMGETLRHLSALGAPSPEIEVIVVDGHPSGDTIAAIDVDGVVPLTSPKGRGAQMNAGAAAARGEALLFLHADTMLPVGAFGGIFKALADPAIAGGAFDLGIRSDRLAFRLIERISSCRSRLTRIPYGDQGIFMRRELFAAVGGYPAIPIMEEVALMRRLKARGERIRFIGGRVMTSARRWERDGILRRTLRNWALILLYLIGVSPEELAKHY